jgi:chromosome segregation ATPase
MWITRRHRAELDALRAENDRLRAERDKAREERDIAIYNRRQSLGQLLDADAANRRLDGRVLELGRRIAALAESDPEHLAAMERELAAAREEAAVEKRRADRLQERLDDAVGLNDPKVLAGPYWRTGTDAAKGGLL